MAVHPLQVPELAADFSAVCPSRLLEWYEEEECCVLLRPRLRSSRIARWVTSLGGDPFYRIRLDEVGTVVWKACDGRTSLAEICTKLRERFGREAEPVEERLAEFVRNMLKGRILKI